MNWKTFDNFEWNEIGDVTLIMKNPKRKKELVVRMDSLHYDTLGLERCRKDLIRRYSGEELEKEARAYWERLKQSYADSERKGIVHIIRINNIEWRVWHLARAKFTNVHSFVFTYEIYNDWRKLIKYF